jgi:hypothetical protein
MADVRFAVGKYLSEGRICLPVRPGEKATRVKKWSDPDCRPTLEDFGADDNVAERLDNIVDIDPDCREGRIACERLLLLTERKHGRPGIGITHYWFDAPGMKFEEFKDIPRPDPKDPTRMVAQNLIEIRTGRFHYTLLPPSQVVKKDQFGNEFPGETVELYWDQEKPAAPVDAKGLRHSVCCASTAALLGRCWPKGSRHKCAIDAAGFLAARELDPKEIEEIIRTAAIIANDDEVEDRARAARDTVATFKAGGKTSGGPSLMESMGDEVLKRLSQWWGGNSAATDGVVEEMNRKHFVVRLGKDEVIGTEDGEQVFFQHEKALYLRYANQLVKIGETQKGANKGKAIEETKFTIWKKSAKRRDFRTVTFMPPPKVADPRDYNLWKGFAVQPLQVPEGIIVGSDAHDRWIADVVVPRCIKYLGLIHDIICGGEPARQEEYFEYLLDLLALTVQRPGEPSEVAVVLKGERGAGKGMFVRNYGALFGRHFVHISKPEQITGKFNAAVSGKIIIFADEAFFAGDKRDLGALKVLITEPSLAIERKGIDVTQEDNFVHLFMASNEDWHTPAGFQERRFFALLVSNTKMQDSDYFDAIKQEMDNGGREAFLTFLLARTITDEKRKALRHAPRTDELRIQQEATLPPELKWWKDCLWSGEIREGEGWPEEIGTSLLYSEYLMYCDRMKVNRRVSDVDMGRRVLALYLGEVRRPRLEGGGRGRSRELLSLVQCREAFDKASGTKTPWPQVIGEGPKGQQPAVPAPSTPDPKDLPF